MAATHWSEEIGVVISAEMQEIPEWEAQFLGNWCLMETVGKVPRIQRFIVRRFHKKQRSFWNLRDLDGQIRFKEMCHCRWSLSKDAEAMPCGRWNYILYLQTHHRQKMAGPLEVWSFQEDVGSWNGGTAVSIALFILAQEVRRGQICTFPLRDAL